MCPGAVTKHAAFVMLLASSMVAPVRANTTDDAFFKAYYIEHERHDYAAAADLYAQVVADSEANRALRAQARARLTVCREELACADLASLMPPQTLVYIELNRPGEQLRRLFDQLGLVKAPGAPIGGQANRVAISPELFQELLGLRGAAVALTGIDPFRKQPTGVAVLHPGDMGVIRALIETGLPVGGEPVDPIEGFPTYRVEGQAFVTLTSRLVVVSNQASLIRDVVARLTSDKKRPSFADDPTIRPLIADRGDDALVFFCVNARKLMPVVTGMMAVGAAQNPKIALAGALLDPNSMESLSGHLGVSDDGLGLDLRLRLAKGHHNLIFNLLRFPGLDEQTLTYVPQGAAAFVALALNEPTYTRGDRHRGTSEDDAESNVVTAMDLGREVFGNIVSVAVFAVPPEGNEPVTGRPIPDVAGIITVNDPAKSEALWTQILGLVSLATGTAPMAGGAVEIAGTPARSYAMPEGVTIYQATVDHQLIISPSKVAFAAAVTARRSGRSILDDPKFASVKDRITDDTTKIVFLHPARCARIARLYMNAGEVARMKPWVDVMEDTVVSVVLNHSNREFHVSARVGGIPDIGALASRFVERQRHQAKARQETLTARQMLRRKFDLLASRGESQAASKVGRALYQTLRDDPRALNNFAWALLTEDRYEGSHNALALECARRSNEITGRGNWAYVDTLALAEFVNGDAEAAVELEQKAIELADGRATDELKASLSRFQAAARRASAASGVN